MGISADREMKRIRSSRRGFEQDLSWTCALRKIKPQGLTGFEGAARLTPVRLGPEGNPGDPKAEFAKGVALYGAPLPWVSFCS